MSLVPTKLVLVVSLACLASFAASTGCGGSDTVPVGADGEAGSSGRSGMSGGSSGSSGTSGGSSGSSGTSGGSSGSSGTSGSSGSGDASTCPTYYQDVDDDGFGGAVTQVTCTPPGKGWVTLGGDCDDADSHVKPGQVSYFGAATAKGSFDYDCNKKEDENPAKPIAGTCLPAATVTGCSGDGYLPAVPARAGAGLDAYCGSSRFQVCRPLALGDLVQCQGVDGTPVPGTVPFDCR